jgi:hypothetical protein
MQTKFKIIETEDYYLALSDKKPVVANQFIYETDTESINKTCSDYVPNNSDFAIIAHLPKNNAPELDLPLLPEIYTVIGQPLESYIKERHNQDKVLGFIDGWEASNKQYTEQDLRKVVEYMLKNPISEELRTELILDFNKGVFVLSEYMKNIIQSLKQPKTPTYFEADIEFECCNRYLNCVGCDATAEMTNLKLKTELINGKETLVGNYLFE